MWKEFAHFVIKYRLYILITLVAITAFMGYQGRNAKLSYEFMRIIPEDDLDMQYYEQFRKTFGEDANSFVLGVKDSSLYELDNFLAFQSLSEDIAALDGINGTISPANLIYLSPDRQSQKFHVKQFFEQPPKTQAELDSIIRKEKEQKFYSSSLFGKDNATLVAISMNPDILNSEQRIPLMNKLTQRADQFTKETGIRLYYAGLPYVRSIMADKVKSELTMFLLLSAGVTALTLFLFFRSLAPVLVPLLMIAMIVVWIMGTLALLDYRITLLTGLLPPVLIVIGIPNSIYLLNKYHQEYGRHGNKILALSTIIKKIGIVTLITNTTTAIGFCVLVLTGISAMQEFGLVAGINIFATFVISITFIPAVFSYLDAPDSKHLNHLNSKATQGIIHIIEILVIHYRKGVYIVSLVILVIAIIGTYKVKALSYMVDDLPDDYHVTQDLKFFEEHFTGVMPLELVIDTGTKKGYRKRGALDKVNEIQDYVTNLPEVTPAVSMVTLLKAANQAFYNGDTSAYRMPTKYETGYLMKYLKNQSDVGIGVSNNFSDSTGRYLRVSMKIADIGSIKMDSLINGVIQPKLTEMLEGSKLEAFITGTTLIFIKGNDFLIQSLKQSMMIAFVLIAIIMGTLFGNLRIVIISLIPNILPLLVTAGIMGYFGIPLKPSTAIVFSIAFGISVDDSIHFLAKYRQEMLLHGNELRNALIVSIRETGTSMVYTSIVLFGGFIIFVASAFGGTIALGLLTSITLLVAMVTNLVLLPSLLYSFDVSRQDLHPIIEGIDEFYFEDEDEEINIDMLKKP